MANLDSLQINITADVSKAETAVDNLERSLYKLNNTLASTSEIAGFSDKLYELVGGMNALTRVINLMDIDKLNGVSSAFSKVVKSVGLLNTSGTAAVTDFSKEVTVGAQRTKGEIEKSISEIEALLLHEYELKEQLQDISYVGRTKSVASEVGDEWKQLNGYGKNIREGVTDANPEIWGKYKSIVGSSLPDNAEQAIIEYTRAIKDADEQIKNLEAQLGKLYAELEKAPETIERAKTAFDTMGADQIVSASDFETPMQNVVQAAENVSTVGEKAGMSLSELASGLSELQGIRVSQDQFAGVSVLASSAATISTVDTTKVSQNLSNVAQGLTTLNGVPTENAERLKMTAQAVNSFGYSSSEKAGANIASVASNLVTLNAAVPEGDKANNLTALGNAIKLFGSAGARHAVENIPRLTQALIEMMSALANAPQVSERTVRLAEAISKFSGRAATATSTANRFSTSLLGLGNNAHRTKLRFTSLAAIFGRLYANFFLLIRGARLVGKAIGYSSQMTEAMNVVDVSFGKSGNKIKDFMQDSIREFGLGKLAAAQYSSRFQAMGKTMSISAEQIGKANEFIAKKISGNSLAYKDLGNSVADMSINLTKLTADMASLYNQDYDSVAQDMQAIYTGMTRPMRKYGIDLSQATMKEFALKNGLDADIASMSQAEKTMLRYQMVMTRASGAMGDFSKTADTWANSMRTVKQLLQEFGRLLGEALINALKPALIAFKNFMYSLITATQNALNAVGKLLGWTKIDFGGAALVEDMEEFADATDDAAGAAKKLKGQLRGIDELNNLTTNQGGGGGGSADSGGTASGTDLWDKIKETKEKYESEIKSWFELGRKIADKFQAAMESIDWESIKKKAAEGARNFADFLNGIFKPEMFAEIGRTIAESFNTALTWLYNFGDELDWEEIGTSLREGVVNFFDTFDWGLAADTIDTWVHGLTTLIASFLEGGEVWSSVSGAINKFFSKLDIDTVDLIVSAIVLVAGARMVVSLARGVLNAITSQIAASISGAVISASLGELALTAGTIAVVATVAYFTFSQLYENATGHGLWDVALPPSREQSGNAKQGKTVSPFYHSTDMSRFDAGNKKVADDNRILIFKLMDKWSEFFTWWSNGLKKWFENPFKATISGLDNIFNKLFYEKSAKIAKKFEDKLTELKTKFDDFCLNFNKGFDNVKSKIAEFKNKWDEFWQDVRNFWTNPLEKSGLESALEKAYEKCSEIATNIKTSILTRFDETKTKWKEKFNEWWKNDVVAKFAYTVWYPITAGINAIKDRAKEAYDKAKEKFENIKSKAEKILSYSAFYKVGKDIKDGLLKPFEAGIALMKAAWEDLKKLVTAGLSCIIKFSADTSELKSALESIAGAMTGLFDAGKSIIDKANEEIDNGNTTPSSDSGDNGKKTSGGGSTSGGGGKKAKTAPAKPPGMTQGEYEQWKKKNGYALGGFPGIGSLFLAGETYGQTEWLGNINGKTGVVGGAEISGIREAILQSSSEEMKLLRQQNELLQGILQKEFGISSDKLFRSVRSSANDYLMRTGNPAF